MDVVNLFYGLDMEFQCFITQRNRGSKPTFSKLKSNTKCGPNTPIFVIHALTMMVLHLAPILCIKLDSNGYN